MLATAAVQSDVQDKVFNQVIVKENLRIQWVYWLLRLFESKGFLI